MTTRTRSRTAAKQSSKPEVDRLGRRSGDDALEGQFVRLVSGEHQGRVGAYVETTERDKDGFPSQILVRSRDEHNELLNVAYSDAKATSYKGGR